MCVCVRYTRGILITGMFVLYKIAADIEVTSLMYAELLMCCV